MRRALTTAAALLTLAAPARADWIFHDGNGTPQTMRAGVAGGGVLPFMTPVDPNANSIVYGQGAAPSTPSGFLSMCQAAASGPSETAGLLYFLSCDLAGNARVLATLVNNGEVIVNPAASFTRPANTTAYASGQLVGNSVTAGSVVPLSFTAARLNGGGFLIRRAIIAKSGTSLTNAQFRLHLYTLTPTLANGDGAAWSTNRSGHVCDIDVTLINAFTDGADGAGVPNVGADCNIQAGGGTTLYGLLEARAAYTPLSGEVFTVQLDDRQN